MIKLTISQKENLKRGIKNLARLRLARLRLARLRLARLRKDYQKVKAYDSVNKDLLLENTMVEIQNILAELDIDYREFNYNEKIEGYF